MSKFLKGSLIFILGAGIGVLGTKTYFEKKYKDICDEEVASVKETFENLRKQEREVNKSKTIAKPDLKTYSSILNQTGYASVAVDKVSEAEEDEDDEEEEVEYIPSVDEPSIVYEVKSTNRPIAIDPDVYGDIVGYDRIELNYYRDGIFADDANNVIENVDDVIGLENIDHFGDYETGALFIRNDARKSYYEVYIDKRLFSEVKGGE